MTVIIRKTIKKNSKTNRLWVWMKVMKVAVDLTTEIKWKVTREN